MTFHPRTIASADAFASAAWDEQKEEMTGECGLTKREYFAALALQGLLACNPDMSVLHNAAATRAVKLAEALIHQLNNPGEEHGVSEYTLRPSSDGAAAAFPASEYEEATVRG